MNTQSVLIIGATGRTGNYIIQQIAKQDKTSNTKIFAFCRDSSKLDTETKAKCQDIIQGDAREPRDLERALEQSYADIVIVAVGNGDNVKKSDIRTKNAEALVQVLNSDSRFAHVKVLVVSSIGAGGLKIKVGFGIGTMIEFHLRHVLKDHNGQEKAFLDHMKDRTAIIRPTGLTENESTGKVVLFGNQEKCPTIQTDREDLANWIIEEAIFEDRYFGTDPINLTCTKN